VVFRLYFGFACYFGFGQLKFLGVSHGFWAFFGRVVRVFVWALGVCWVGVFDGGFGCCGSLWVFLDSFCGLAGLFLCILLVYSRVPYTFLIKFPYLSKKNIS
jgi:hypothetical protein